MENSYVYIGGTELEDRIRFNGYQFPVVGFKVVYGLIVLLY